MNNFLTVSSDEIIESPQSPARIGFLRLPLSPVEEDSPDRRQRTRILWDTRTTPMRENDRIVGINNRKQKSSSEIQQHSKKIKRHHSSPVLKSKKLDEMDQATQNQRLEDFRKLLLNTDHKREECVAKEVDGGEKLQTDSFDMDMNDWDNIEAEAAKDLEEPKTLLNDTDDLEEFLLAIPSEILNGEVIPDKPLTFKLEPQVTVKQVNKAKTDPVMPTTSVNSNDNDMRAESGGRKPVASKDEIEQKRLEAMRRRELMKKTKSEPSTSGTSSNNKATNVSVEMPEEISKLVKNPKEIPEEIRRQIELNKQEALRRQQKNKILPAKVETLLTVPSASNLMIKPSTSVQNQEKTNKAKEQALTDINQSSTSCSTSLSQETKRKIEKNRLEAIKRRELWLKNQNKKP